MCGGPRDVQNFLGPPNVATKSTPLATAYMDELPCNFLQFQWWAPTIFFSLSLTLSLTLTNFFGF